MLKTRLINYDNDDDEVFIGRDLAHTRAYGENIASLIDQEIKRIIDECYQKSKSILLEHEGILHRCAELLLEKEKISRDEFEALFEGWFVQYFVGWPEGQEKFLCKVYKFKLEILWSLCRLIFDSMVL